MSETRKISRFPVPEVKDLTKEMREEIAAMKEKAGFVPNVLMALAHRPAELNAFKTYNDAVMNKESGLSAAEKEMLIIAFSSENGCTYCVISHGASLRMASQNPLLSDQITANYKEADITPRQRAMIDFAMKVSNDSRSINEGDYETLRSFDFSDEDIWDIAAITAFYNLSNRMMNFLAVRPDEAFYMMGRK